MRSWPWRSARRNQRLLRQYQPPPPPKTRTRITMRRMVWLLTCSPSPPVPLNGIRGSRDRQKILPLRNFRVRSSVLHGTCHGSATLRAWPALARALARPPWAGVNLRATALLDVNFVDKGGRSCRVRGGRRRRQRMSLGMDSAVSSGGLRIARADRAPIHGAGRPQASKVAAPCSKSRGCAAFTFPNTASSRPTLNWAKCAATARSPRPGCLRD